MSTDFKTMLADARPPERTVPVCLRGDLVADHEAAERDLELAERQQGNSLEDGGVSELVERIEALEEQMREHTYPFRVRALPRLEFKRLVNAFPPRKTDEGEVDERDKFIGVNGDDFFPVLIKACVVDPVLDDTEWTLLLDEKLTDRQFDQLQSACWYINRSDVDVPFSRAASRIRRSSETE